MGEPKYIVDKNGNRTDVLMPIGDYLELMDNLEDLKALAERKDEETIEHEEVKSMLVKND